MKMTSLRDLFVHQVQDLWDAETRLLDHWSDLAGSANSVELRSFIEMQHDITRAHVGRLEQICSDLSISANRVTCYGMKGLVDECRTMCKTRGDESTRDAGLICAIQRVLHYEIAGFGCAHSFARRLGFDVAGNLLHECAVDAGDADKRLTSLAESTVNIEAAKVY